MADDFTSDKIAALLQGTGDNENDWGSRCNDETITPLAAAIAGYLEKDVAGAVDVTLTDDEAVNAFIKLTGAITADIDVIVPAKEGGYFIWNATSGSFDVTVKTDAGTGIEVLQDTRAHLWCDATNVVAVSAAQAFDAPTATGSSGNYTATPAEPKPTALRAGMPFAFKANHANTGAATLTWAGLTQKNLYLVGSSGPAAMTGGEIKSGAIISGYYDGAQFVATAGIINSGVAVLTAANTFSADQTIQSSDSGGGNAPNLTLDRNSSSPAVSDVLGAMIFQGRDSGGGTDIYARITATITDPTAGSEDATINFQTVQGGSLGNAIAIGQGLYSVGVTGGDKGLGTINLPTLYQGGTAINSLAGMAKAWAIFSGTNTGTNAPASGYNVASVTRNGTGDYTITFTTAFSSANYAPVVWGQRATASDPPLITLSSIAAGSFRIITRNGAGSAEDYALLFIHAFGV